MQQLKCDVCGGKLVMDQSRKFATCENCGMEYSLETMQEMMKALQGAELNVKGIATEQSLIDYAYSFINENVDEAEKKFREVLQLNSKNSKAWKGIYDCEWVRMWNDNSHFFCLCHRFDAVGENGLPSFQYKNEQVYGGFWQEFKSDHGDSGYTVHNVIMHNSFQEDIPLYWRGGKYGEDKIFFSYPIEWKFFCGFFEIQRGQSNILTNRRGFADKAINYIKNAIQYAVDDDERKNYSDTMQYAFDDAKTILAEIMEEMVCVEKTFKSEMEDFHQKVTSQARLCTEKIFRQKTAVDLKQCQTENKCIQCGSKLTITGKCSFNKKHSQDIEARISQLWTDNLKGSSLNPIFEACLVELLSSNEG